LPTIANVNAIISTCIDRRAGVPAVAACRRVGSHRGAIGRDTLAVKCRLRETPLSEMEVAFAREQPFAEQHLRPLEPPPLVKVPVVRDEHIPHEIRMAEQVERLGA